MLTYSFIKYKEVYILHGFFIFNITTSGAPMAITRLDIGVKFLQSLGVLYPYIKP